MRLSSEWRNVLRETVKNTFPGAPRTMLFGSRTRDDARGGDIDLLVVSDLPASELAEARIRALARMHLALGEQHIDLVVTSDPEHDERLIVKEALRTGVEL